jgi:methionyl-tRNA synthetase
VPRVATSIGSPYDNDIRDAVAVYEQRMNDYQVHDGAAQMMYVAASANRYIEETAPWKLAKQQANAELDVVLANLARTLVRLAILAHPFMPQKADAVWNTVCPGLPLEPATLQDAVIEVEGRAVGAVPILFPKPVDAARGPETT